MVTGSVVLRFYAAAREAVGKTELTVEPNSVEAIISALTTGDAQALRILSKCSVLINGEICHDRGRLVSAGDAIDVLPPFAGG